MNGLESFTFQPDTPGSHTRNPPETTTPNQIITLLVDLVYPLFLATLMAWLKALKAPWVAPLEVQEASPVAHLSSFLKVLLAFPVAPFLLWRPVGPDSGAEPRLIGIVPRGVRPARFPCARL